MSPSSLQEFLLAFLVLQDLLCSFILGLQVAAIAEGPIRSAALTWTNSLASRIPSCADRIVCLCGFAMASLYPPRPVLTSQKFTPSPDYVEARRSLNGGKLPHREPTGNTQSQSLHGVVSRYQSPVALSPSMQHGIHAAIVPSQSLDSLYRLQTPRPHPRYQRRARSPVNPLYYWPAFRQYRNRQAHKDTQKDKGGVWRRPELEDAFVDGMQHLSTLSTWKTHQPMQPFYLCLTWGDGSSPCQGNSTAATC